MNGLIRILPLAALWLLPIGTSWAAGLPAISLETTEDGGQAYSLSIQVLALMTAITLLPAILLSMTAFTRIIVVLALLRQALGTGATPSNQILLGLALFMTLFVMAPVGSEIYESAVQPYFDETMEGELALERAAGPIRTFMLANTRENHLGMFASMRDENLPENPEDVAFSVLAAAFITSELTTAFQIGFFIFIPFVVIDLVVASVLMSMGMMMLSPMLISLPFKVMLFVLVDGWTLVLGTLAGSFAI
ncbi:flagellar type III secretion system pore protein FliP [Abyssibacter profundi]|uniref:Flagellar biosynthetic protein FliP n=1 Tax=Abyssibacter profundi TaxID=2182787 RepID=A0A383XQP7_9GAMM|nr:flagellar type III secretion system pore protein FliP [Abyssibacter profundi]PWN54951.1 flagellar biosynthetic protein FliP [Abyssibacter profundi]